MELVDMHAWGACGRKPVGVRLSSLADCDILYGLYPYFFVLWKIWQTKKFVYNLSVLFFSNAAMATIFHTLDKDLYNQEWFFADYQEAQWAHLSSDQSEKLFFLLNQDNDQAIKNTNVAQSDDNAIKEKVAWPGEVSADGAIFDVWDSLDFHYQNEIEHGISYVLESGDRPLDILLGMWPHENTQWRASTVWSHDFIDNYRIMTKQWVDVNQKSDDQYMLLLRVIPQGETDAWWKKVLVDTVLLQQPWKKSLVMPWMVFTKKLEGQEIVDTISQHKMDLQ